MAAKPTTIPRWARTAGGVDAANLATPSSGEQDVGYTVGQNPVSSSKTNWLIKFLCQWAAYLADAIFVATAAGGLDGVKATGDGAAGGGNFTGGATGPGVIATPGGGAGPNRGALQLSPQVAPGSPADGDVWLQTTLNLLKARINGATRTVLDQTIAALANLTYVGNPGNAASTGYVAWAGTSQGAVAVNGAGGGVGQSRHQVGFAGVIRGFTVVTGQLTAGGTVTLTLFKLSPAGVQQGTGITVTIPAATAANSVFSVTGAFQLAAGDSIEMAIQNNVGVTASIGLSSISVQVSSG